MRRNHPQTFFLAIILFMLCLQPLLWAQTDSASDANKSWTSTTQQSSTSATWNPVRTRASHTESNGRSVDKQSIERVGPDGRYEPYLDVEKESVQVDASTVRTVERTYSRDVNGQKTLIQVAEEETRTLAGGGQKLVRTISDPDMNGRLQIASREIQDVRQTSPDVRDTKTTILTRSTEGGLAPAVATEQREIKRSDQVTEFRKSTSLADLNGKWQLSEVKEGVIKEDGKGRIKEERTLRPGTDGTLGLVERTISRESETASGEKRQTVETYAPEDPGKSGERNLELSQRVTTVRRSGSEGREVTQEQREERNPAAPTQDLRVTQKTIDIVRPGSGGKSQENRTIQTVDPNGSLGVVWVDMGQTTRAPSIQVDTKKAGSTPAPKAATTPQPKP